MGRTSMNWSRSSVAAAAVTLAVILAATSCGEQSADAALATALDRGSFVVTSARGIELPPASNLRIVFDDPDGASATLGVSGGCNLIGGEIRFDDGVLISVDGWIQTEMACDEPLMKLDTDTIALLDARPTVTLDGDRLVIDGGATALTLDRTTD